MKIIDEQGRFLKKINIIDLLLILAITISVVFVGFQYVSKLSDNLIEGDEAVSYELMTTVVRIRNASEFVQEELLRRPLEGEQMVSGADYIDGYITNVEFVDANNQYFSETEGVLTITDDVRKDVLITMEWEVLADDPILLLGAQEVRVGKTFYVKTREFEMTATVETINLEPLEESMYAE